MVINSAESANRRETAPALTGTLSNATALLIGQAATGAFLIVVARRTDPDVFGVFAAAYAAALVFGGLLDFGSSQLMTRDLAQGIHRDVFRAWLLKRGLVQLPAATTLAVGIAVLASPRVSMSAATVVAMQAFTYPLSQGALAAVRAMRSPAVAAWFAVIGNMTMLIAVIAAPVDSVLMVAALGATGSWILTSMLALAATRHLVDFGSMRAAGHPWKGSLPFGVASVSYASPGLHFGLIALGAGAAQAGLAAAVQKWTQPIQLLPNAFSTQMFPAFAAAPDHRSALRLLRSNRIIVPIGSAAVVLILVFAPQLIQAVLGPEYADAVPVLRLYALATLPILVAQPLSVFLQARGDERAVARISFGMAWIGLVAVYLVSLTLGAKAAPMVAGGSWLLLALVYGRRTQRLERT